MRRSIAVIALALLMWPLSAQEPKLFHVEVPEAATLPEASSDCAAGVVYDDGVFSDFYGLSPAWVVMRFDLPTGTTALDQVCSCFTRANAQSSTSLPFDVVVFDNNGSGGGPGTFLGSVAATATNMPLIGDSDFFNVSLANAGIVLPDTSVYVGVRYNSENHYICGDSSPGLSQREVYHSFNGTDWSSSATAFSGEGPRVWGIRVDPATQSFACTPTQDALCLNGGRFRVAVTFESLSGWSGNGQAIKLKDDSGYFWFFDDANVEVVVKVLDGCSNNGHYWFFAGGLTDVQAVISVTDTKNGMFRTYSNPQKTAFQPIQDTSAFATCP